jgi:hypothetical protein
MMWDRLRYTAWAPAYDALIRAAGFDAARRLSIDRLRLAPGGSVLIVGAGTGLDLDFRLLNAVAKPLFSDLNRRLGPLIAGTPLAIEHDEPVAFGGTYRVVTLLNLLADRLAMKDRPVEETAGVRIMTRPRPTANGH